MISKAKYRIQKSLALRNFESYARKRKKPSFGKTIKNDRQSKIPVFFSESWFLGVGKVRETFLLAFIKEIT